jgi:hypothetical protein
MGLATGTPCCGCRVVRWRVCAPFIIPWYSHGLFYGKTAAEHIIVGTANGFLIPLSDGYGNFDNYIELENTGTNTWDLHVRYNGVGIDTVSFTHNFTTGGLKDVTFEWTPGDTYRQVVTIILYDDPRPDTLWNLPNRDIPELTHIYGTNDGFGNVTYSQALLDDSVSDANYQYYTDGFYSTRIKKKRNPAIAQSIQFPIQNTMNTGGGAVSHSPVFANESPTNLYFPNTSNDFSSYIYEATDPPLMEKITFSSFTDANLSFSHVMPTYRRGVNGQKTYELPYGIRTAVVGVDTLFFDVTGIEAIFGLSITSMKLYYRLHYGYIKLWAEVYYSGSFVAGTFESQNFAIDGAGNFSGNLTWTDGVDDELIPIDGNIINENLAAGFWPHDDETMIEPLCPKIWLPEYFESEQTIEATFNWALKKDTAATINGIAAMIAHNFGTPSATTGTAYGTDSVTAVVSIASGSLPTGMTSNLPASPALSPGTSGFYSDGKVPIVISGTPTANSTGSVTFEVDINNGGINQTYISRTYTWKVGTGSFTITYPSPYSTSMTPPSGANDWRIEDGSSPSIICTTTGGTGPYTYSVHSGTLPTGCTINASTGEIYAVLPVTGFATTGSVVIKCVDSLSAEAFSPTYDWEFV